MSKKKKLTFFTGGEDVFLRDIIINLRNDYDIKFFQRGQEQEFHQLMHDTDIAWFEWCDDLVKVATVPPKMCKYVCRLHSYEMFTPIPGQIDWNKIDKLVFVNEVVEDYTLKRHNIRPDISTVIHNGVDVDKFNIPKDKKINKKVAFVGYINYKKGPELLLQTFKKIWDYDNEFEFHIAGQHQDPRIELYFAGIMNKLPFKLNMDGWVQDMPTYLKDKDFVISTSLFESFQYSLAEGMCQGAIPLVHSWIGSEQLYPKEYIWTWPEECVSIIDKFYKKSDEDKKADMEKARKHIVDNYSIKDRIVEIKEMLESL